MSATKASRSAGDRIQLRHPDAKKKMPRMPKEQYALATKAALAVLPKTPPGITLGEFLDGTVARLQKDRRWDASRSPSWYAMAIKLDLEARGELRRVDRKSPQRLVRG